MFNLIRDNIRENNRHAQPLYPNRFYPNHQNNHWNPLRPIGHLLRDNFRENDRHAIPLYPYRTIDRRLRTYNRPGYRVGRAGISSGPYMMSERSPYLSSSGRAGSLHSGPYMTGALRSLSSGSVTSSSRNRWGSSARWSTGHMSW